MAVFLLLNRFFELMTDLRLTSPIVPVRLCVWITRLDLDAEEVTVLVLL